MRGLLMLLAGAAAGIVVMVVLDFAGGAKPTYVWPSTMKVWAEVEVDAQTVALLDSAGRQEVLRESYFFVFDDMESFHSPMSGTMPCGDDGVVHFDHKFLKRRRWQ